MSKKTVGIITIQKSLVSHGASLQSYALWSYIKSIGFNCEVIDLYRPVMEGYVADTASLSFSTCNKSETKNRLIKNIIKSILSLIKKTKAKKNILKKQRFESFNSLVNYSKSFNSIDSLYKNPPNYDYYITGSDQVWNTDMPFENEAYLLNFVPNDKKCISYASSFGRNNLPDIYRDNYRECLKRYDTISVREASGQSIISELTGKVAFLAIDPTMLFCKDSWKTLSVRPDIQQKYLFCFSLHNSKELIEFAASLCKKRKIALLIISDITIEYDGVQIINLPEIGPKEWLGLIENAETVVTDSFHGTAFSILFEKKFLSYVKSPNSESGRGTRIESLLSQLTLNKCLLNDLKNDYENFNETINYNQVNRKLENIRTGSKEFLTKALS